MILIRIWDKQIDKVSTRSVQDDVGQVRLTSRVSPYRWSERNLVDNVGTRVISLSKDESTLATALLNYKN